MVLGLSKQLEEHKQRRGLLFVVSGPSGVGKGTILKRVLDTLPNAKRCITCTTRSPRGSEVDGVDYCFLTEQKFRAMIEAGEFLEYAQVHANLYGTPLGKVNEILEQGYDVFLEIDVQGGLTVKNKLPSAVSVFIAPPSMEELERRLRGRATDAEEVIARRLKNAQGEIDCMPKYDYLIVNESVETAADRLRCIVMAERARIR